MSCSTSSISSSSFSSFTMGSAAAATTSACTVTQSASQSQEQLAIMALQQRIRDDKGGTSKLTSDLLAIRDKVTILDLSQCKLDLKKLQVTCLQCKNITELNLSGCGLTGEELSSLRTVLKNVHILNLADNKITAAGLKCLASFTQFTQVTLTANAEVSATTIEAALKGRCKVITPEMITAVETRLWEVAGNYSWLTNSEKHLLLTTGPYVNTLYLFSLGSDCTCTPINLEQLAPTLKQLPNLKRVSLKGNYNLTDLPQFPQTLEKIELSGCSHLPPQALASLTNYPNLKKVDLSRNSTITGLPEFPQTVEEITVTSCMNLSKAAKSEFQRNHPHTRLID